ncbi:MAG: hypothetical protein A2157_00940 [Deltaproteobacteria bacterium RBG_16_47_11]|nr:MAG: hypothetical protein A2157_00940 [Deltaproteobacteria bacterium RBG_16_47_11]
MDKPILLVTIGKFKGVVLPLSLFVSPGQFVDRPGTGCDFLPAPYFDTVSNGRGRRGEKVLTAMEIESIMVCFRI